MGASALGGSAGGSAGGGGALAGILSVTHATVDTNGGATAGSGGGATAGTLQGSGAAGTATPGAQGAGGGGAVANGGTTTLINTIVAANSPANCSGGVTDDTLAAVQKRREFPTRATQRMQLILQNSLIGPALQGTGPRPKAPLPRTRSMR